MTRTTFRIAATLALLSTSQLQAAAPAPAKPCMTQVELRGMVAYVMPSAMSTLIDRCKSALPAGASLLTRGAQLVTEFEGGRIAAFPMARQAFAKFSDSGDKNATAIMLIVPEETLRPIVDDTVTQKLIGSITAKDCPDIDRVFATLEPLPASNFIDLVTQVVAIGARDDKQMSVCAA